MFTSFHFAGLLPLVALAIISSAILTLEMVYRWRSRSRYVGVDGLIRTLPAIRSYRPTPCVQACLSSSPALSRKEQNIRRACSRIRKAAQHKHRQTRPTTVFRVSCDVVAWSDDKVRTREVWQAIAIPATQSIDLESLPGGAYRIKGSQS